MATPSQKTAEKDPEASILVFDSGLGGLSVHSEITKVMPGLVVAYLADDAAFPYGRLPPDVLIERVKEVIGAGIRYYKPALVVVACNTASTLCLPALRSSFDVPFVGTVPAVKPAAAMSKTKIFSILGTPGTVRREYTHDLVIEHAADCYVKLVGAPHLAALAEAFLRGDAVTDEAVKAEILPCFVEKNGARTDSIALACTHYPLLLDIYKRVAPWPVTWVDPAPAIASRVKNLLNDGLANVAEKATRAIGEASFTSGNAVPSRLAATLLERGLRSVQAFTLPFSAVSD